MRSGVTTMFWWDFTNQLIKGAGPEFYKKIGGEEEKEKKKKVVEEEEEDEDEKKKKKDERTETLHEVCVDYPSLFIRKVDHRTELPENLPVCERFPLKIFNGYNSYPIGFPRSIHRPQLMKHLGPLSEEEFKE